VHPAYTAGQLVHDKLTQVCLSPDHKCDRCGGPALRGMAFDLDQALQKALQHVPAYIDQMSKDRTGLSLRDLVGQTSCCTFCFGHMVDATVRVVSFFGESVQYLAANLDYLLSIFFQDVMYDPVIGRMRVGASKPVAQIVQGMGKAYASLNHGAFSVTYYAILGFLLGFDQLQGALSRVAGPRNLEKMARLSIDALAEHARRASVM
jgi:hypothetical protein